MSDTLNTAVKEAVISNAAPSTATKLDAKATADTLTAAIKADPVLMNTLSQEPWWQSGVGVFGTGGLLWALGVIFNQVGMHGADLQAYDTGVMWTAVPVVLGFVGVLYRRYVPGLKPMFSGWFKR